MKPRDLAINLGLLLGTTVVFFGGIEFALRVTGLEKGQPTPPQLYQHNSNPEISYDLKPNLHEKAFRSTVTTNSFGFRSPELDPAKPTVAFIGDSIAFGYGLENDQTVPSQLGQLWNGKYNILNAGTPGYNLRQEAATYDAKVKSHNPVALFLIFHWNDLRDTSPGILDPEGNLRPADWQPTARICAPIEQGILGYVPGRCWLDLHSAFYRAVKKFVSARQERQNLEQQIVDYQKHADTDSVTPAQIDKYKQVFDRFAKTLPKTLPRILVMWPEKEFHRQAVPVLRAMAEAQGFKVIDLYETFGNTAETLTWDTVHPSAKTAKAAAGVIPEKMKGWKMAF